MEMSTATAQWVAQNVTPETFALFDFVNVMAYDNDLDRHSHASYEYSIECLNYFSERKQIPKDKLVLGVHSTAETTRQTVSLTGIPICPSPMLSARATIITARMSAKESPTTELLQWRKKRSLPRAAAAL